MCDCNGIFVFFFYFCASCFVVFYLLFQKQSWSWRWLYWMRAHSTGEPIWANHFQLRYQVEMMVYDGLSSLFLDYFGLRSSHFILPLWSLLVTKCARWFALWSCPFLIVQLTIYLDWFYFWYPKEFWMKLSAPYLSHPLSFEAAGVCLTHRCKD